MPQRRVIGAQPPHKGGNPLGHNDPVRTRTNRIPFVRAIGTQANLSLIQNRAPGIISPRPRPPGNPTAETL
jgi:hypothetical protein